MGEALAAIADEAGKWFTYTFHNPGTGAMQTKHSWVVRHDGKIFGSGWYEPGQPKSDPAAYTQTLVRQAMALYDAVGAERDRRILQLAGANGRPVVRVHFRPRG